MENYKIKIINRQVGKIKVIVPYNPIYIKKLKDIKRHRWNPEEKCWFFPKSDNIIERQIDIFKDEDMWIDPYVSDKTLGKIKSPLDSIIFNKKEAKR